VAPNGLRESRAELLFTSGAPAGSPSQPPGWVVHTEGGIKYGLDITRSMFASGNGTERMRMGRLHAAGEVVVDLFAGIGYFTLPLLVRAGAAKVYACEWNPSTVAALRWNLERNKVAHKCVVLPGDNRKTIPPIVAPAARGVSDGKDGGGDDESHSVQADRVLLGLLPSSEESWRLAVAALKAHGGCLHVHGNVAEGRVAQWAEHAAARMQALAWAERGLRWDVAVAHVERVKSYAPRVLHVVADLRCTASSTSGNGTAASCGHEQQSSCRLPSPGTSIGAVVPQWDRQRSNVREGSDAREATERRQRQQPPPDEGDAEEDDAGDAAAELAELRNCSAAEGRVPCVDVEAVRRGASVRSVLRAVARRRVPTLLRSLDLGEAVGKWTPEYLGGVAGLRERLVSCHVSCCKQLDFVDKNFTFETMPFADLVRRVQRRGARQPHPDEYLYFRSVGGNPRKERSHLHESFPELAAELQLPELWPSPERYFSSCLRLASPGLQLWTHFDVMDNCLVQVMGTKRVVLFPPSEYSKLYVRGSSSAVLDVDHADAARFPEFAAAQRIECTMQEGDVLFIPALWFHNVTANDFSVAVNCFWRHLDASVYPAKDLYGNQDLVPAAKAQQHVAAAREELARLPQPYRDFYAQACLQALRE